MHKKNSFAVSNLPKCIANLRTQPMHFKMNLETFIKLHLLNWISALMPIWALRAWLGLQSSGSLIPRTNHGPTYDVSEIDEFWIYLKSSIPIDLLEFGGWTQISILLDFPFALNRNLDLEIKIMQMDYPSQDEKNHCDKKRLPTLLQKVQEIREETHQSASPLLTVLGFAEAFW